jgi:hypothetical protein
MLVDDDRSVRVGPHADALQPEALGVGRPPRRDEDLVDPKLERSAVGAG